MQTLFCSLQDQFDTHVHDGLLNVYTYYGSERTKDQNVLAEQDVVLTTYQTLSSEFSKVGIPLTNGPCPTCGYNNSPKNQTYMPYPLTFWLPHFFLYCHNSRVPIPIEGVSGSQFWYTPLEFQILDMMKTDL